MNIQSILLVTFFLMIFINQLHAKPITSKHLDKIEAEHQSCLKQAVVSPQANECDREAVEEYIASMKKTGISVNEDAETGLWKQFSTLYSDCEVGLPPEMERTTVDESLIAGCRLAIAKYYYSLPK